MNGSPWAAFSPCSEACVTDNAARTHGDWPRVGRATAVRRCAAFGTTLAGTAAIGGRLAAADELQHRASRLVADLGVRVVREGGPLPVPRPVAGTGTLVVANHISWLDALALLAVQPATLLAKREVGRWPVVGRLVRRAGTRFIDREGFRELPGTVRELAALLRSGESVIVFPEGTTWCSVPGGSFRRATFQAALDAGAPVRPVTLTYTCHGAPTALPAFVGEGTFVSSFRRVAAADGLTVRITAHPALHPAGHDRRSLAALAHAAVTAAPRSPATHPSALPAGTAPAPPPYSTTDDPRPAPDPAPRRAGR